MRDYEKNREVFVIFFFTQIGLKPTPTLNRMHVGI
jgi:hypothetical protein